MSTNVIQQHIETFTPDYQAFIKSGFIQSVAHEYGTDGGLTPENITNLENRLSLYFLLLADRKEVVYYLQADCGLDAVDAELTIKSILSLLPTPLVESIDLAIAQIRNPAATPTKASIPLAETPPPITQSAPPPTPPAPPPVVPAPETIATNNPTEPAAPAQPPVATPPQPPAPDQPPTVATGEHISLQDVAEQRAAQAEPAVPGMRTMRSDVDQLKTQNTASENQVPIQPPAQPTAMSQPPVTTPTPPSPPSQFTKPFTGS